MAINQNHLFEELNGVKCAIVERGVTPVRVGFLRGILEFNGYTVVVVASPPPKAAGVAIAPGAGAKVAGPAADSGTVGAGEGAGASGAAAAPAQPAPETFTVGVTDVMFNPVNAIFGRLLKAPGGHVVTLAYWKQQAGAPDDERPYFAGR